MPHAYLDQNKQKEIGIRIERMRKRRGYTQDQMGAWLDGRSGVQFGAIERGERKKLTYEELDRIAQILDVPLSYIISGYPEPLPRPPDATLADLETVLKAYIPVFDQIPEAEPVDYIAMGINPVPESVRALRIKGLCLEPDIMEGDTVLVDRQLTPIDGDIVLCLRGNMRFGHLTTDAHGRKRLEESDGLCEQCDQDLHNLYGTVIWVQRRIKQ